MLVTIHNQQSISIPDEVLASLSLGDGDSLEMKVEGGRLVLTPVRTIKGELCYTESGLAKEREADEALQKGEVRTFDNKSDLLEYLDAQ